ncbi:hypothetical protein RHSIM_Rhsim04G0048200 [Rhododendron simsii]|uniref:non-specific serine/threonine protein kinase n=1 Tax=Rhododendron simsii TaxID=118357 RepID=A0A834LRH6_RHOSS|nr:hypothetical protein RHSIM_Rhsim04G0048200 [Rhododendron simsii]
MIPGVLILINMFRSKLGLSFSLSIISLCLTTVEPTCSKGCGLALGSYYVWTDAYTRLIANVSGNSVNELISYNPGTTEFFILSYERIVVPFPCDCIDGEFLAHVFTYTARSGDTYDKIAETYYSNLTTAATLERSNSYPANSSIPVNATVNVTVNCSCGNASVSEAYGLFVTYPLRAEDNLESIADAANLSTDLLQRYNPGTNFSAGSGLVYIPGRVLPFSLLIIFLTTVEPKCPKTCDLALGSYNVWPDANLTFIAEVSTNSIDEILSYNKDNIPNKDFIGGRINVPLTCDCIDDEFLGHVFPYAVQSGDTYDMIAETYYANLTTGAWLARFNGYEPSWIPDNAVLNVTVNFSEGSGLVYIPGSDKSGNYPPLKSSTGFLPDFATGLSGGVIAGICVGVVMGALLVSVCIYYGFCRKKKVLDKLLSSKSFEDRHLQAGWDPGSTSEKSDSTSAPGSASSRGLAISLDKSMEFSYEELANATNDFSIGHKIAQGGFGAVYYAELRGEKAAIKKMHMMATREFLSELKVLTHVHHLNLVRLIGYCVEGSLFLVYEYIENGNLSKHLHGTGWDPLPWSTRVQIALDSARGLEYIHEHTVPVYIHRDIKTANILIDKNFRAKVADFGLTKLAEVGGSSQPTRLVGTVGYVPPEYAQHGDVSPKIDVYAFGVVLYELISAKEAIVKVGGSMLESKGLVALFEEVLNQPDSREKLCKLVDPRLGDSYPIDSVRKLAQLAKACTQENPLLRPSMRSAVVALMTLSSSTEDWDDGSFGENQALVKLMSGR